MAPTRFADRPVNLRRDVSEDEYESDDAECEPRDEVDNELESQSASDSSGTESDDNGATHEEEESETDAPNEDADDLKDISFGVLAKAQLKFAPPSKAQKRKLSTAQSSEQPAVSTRDAEYDEIKPWKKPKQDLAQRGSKHAPTISSSRNPVSRRREIFSPPPVLKSRDPRFDPAITARTLNPSSTVAASKAYSFLSEYQASEILQLKSEIKKAQTKNPARAEELKKQVMSMESRLRNAENQAKEQEILRRHKAEEKKAIREGRKSKPYFLKKSDLKKEIEKERLEGMGKRAKDKMEKRKRMREKKKEARDMPWARRTG